MRGARRPRRGTIPEEQQECNDGSGRSHSQRTGLRSRRPDLTSPGESAPLARPPADTLGPETTPGKGNPVNKGPPRLAAGLSHCLPRPQIGQPAPAYPRLVTVGQARTAMPGLTLAPFPPATPLPGV
jgi:hypothetical protein